jgi:hypothetical protein
MAPQILGVSVTPLTLFMGAAFCGTLLVYIGLWLHQRLTRKLGIDAKRSERPTWSSAIGFVGWAIRVGRLLLVLTAAAIVGAAYIAAPPTVGRSIAIAWTVITVMSLCFRRMPRLLAAGASKSDVGLWLAVTSGGILFYGILMFRGAGAFWEGR